MLIYYLFINAARPPAAGSKGDPDLGVGAVSKKRDQYKFNVGYR
jgi:hypothetical protein